MEFKNILLKAKTKEITEDEALFLYNSTESSIENCLRLFSTASFVRDNEVGKMIRLDGFMGGVTPCEIDPPCAYCWRNFYKNNIFDDSSVITMDELALGVEAIAKTGTTTIEIGGGTTPKAAQMLKEAVKVVKNNSNMEIWINVGPSLNKSDVNQLKELGVKGFACSLETINQEIFSKVKSGDSMEKRKELIEIIDNQNIDLHSVLMVGLQESFKDRVEHMFYLKQFKSLKWFLVTWLHSPPGTIVEKFHQPSPLEAARTVAIARLIFRNIYTHVSGWQHLHLWLMAGCNRFVHAGAGLHKHRKGQEGLAGHGSRPPIDAEIKEINQQVKITNLLPVTVKYVKEVGLEVEPSLQKYLK